jgi:tetratricopeptide (TPR) repeat protein
LTSLPEGLARQRQELDLLIALGPALIATKGYSAAEVGETLSRATALAEQVDRTDYLLMLLYGQFAYYNTRCDFEPALSFAKRLEQIGEEQNNTVALLQGRLYQGITYYWLGEFERARALFEQCHGLGEPAIRQTLSGRSAVTGAFGFGRGHSTTHPLARSNRHLTQHTVCPPRADQAPDCAHNPASARQGLGGARVKGRRGACPPADRTG